MNSIKASFVSILTLVCITFNTSPINAQTRRGETQQDRPASQSTTPEPVSGGALADVDKDYQVSAGDVIQIQVVDAPELSYYYRVNSLGFIEMPEPIGMVDARKKTASELARMIAKKLRDQEYLRTPNVLANIVQYNSQTFFVQGSVNKPGVYQTEGRPSLLTIIGLAGGLTEAHGSTAFILRPSKTQKPETGKQAPALQSQAPDSIPTAQPQTDDQSEPAAKYELIKANLSALYKGQFDQNQKLEPGDIINIPRVDVFFVAGEVRHPGSFPLKDGTTLRQAISLAQGMTFNSKPAQGTIFREDPLLGTRKEIKVDIGAVMKGKQEDVVVLANDVIIVPNSRTKSVGGVLLMAFGVNATRYPVR